ncbi:DHA2 family efflux MFS transporter permease subunit [Pelosinus sp. sgz500959]|uniref:DHA2 family efflux MFS transporter permease subunit n=1 Tax=Pelosinus sp. sgz500959 TaxID=3242472 RepID=UPI0036732D18
MFISNLSIKEEHYRWWALGVTVIGSFMSILDTSIVNIAIPKMMAVFSVGTDDAQWILTAYMLTMGVIQPATGYLCEAFGTRRMYLLSLMVFTMGSFFCGVAWNNDSMIVFRILQAIGGGLIIPVTMTIVYKVFPIEQRNIAMGIWGISAMVAPAVGPTLSGYLVEYWDWRLIFTINIPIGVIGYGAAALVLREMPFSRHEKFDIAGFITSALGLFCLLLALSKGTEEGWTSAYIIALFYTSIASLTLFVFIELQHENPILDLRIFRDWNFTFSMITTFVGTMGLYGAIFMVPLFMENLRGYTAMQTGVLLFPSAATAGLLMPIAAKLADRFGAKPVVVAGIFLLGAGTMPLMYMDMDTSYEYVMGVMVVRGLGLGLFMMPVTVMGMTNIPLDKVSRASSINNALRQISGSMGIAILTTVLQNRQILHLQHIAEDMTIASPIVQNMVMSGQKLFMYHGDVPWKAHVKSLAVLSQLSIQQSSIFSFDDSFYVLSLICLLGVIPALMLKATKPRKDGVAVMIE